MKSKFFMILFLFLFLFASYGCPLPSDINIEICLNNSQPTKARNDCPNTEVRGYTQGTTFPICTIDHNDYVYIDICNISHLIPNLFCDEGIKVGKEYIKGTEPTSICGIHVKSPDPPFPYPEVIEDIHAGFLGIHLWFYSGAWDAATFEATLANLKDTLHETRIRYVGVIDFFLWLSDYHSEHAHLNSKAPYLQLADGSFDLSKWQPRYFELFEAFVIACKEHDIIPAPHLFMDRYCYGPFENNINGVSRFWSDEAFPYQAAFAEKICVILDKYFDDYWIKPINEAAHYGNQDMFHTIGLWHKKMWDVVLHKYIPISRLIVDLSMSEGGQIYLNEPLLCGKPYEEGATHGDPSRDRSDINNSILPEWHTFSVKEHITDETFAAIYNSRWQRIKIHGDGSDLGNFDLAGTGFRQGDADETYDFGYKAWEIAFHYSKQVIIGIFPMEAFRIKDEDGNWIWNLWFENYHKDNILWDRIDALVRAHKAIYQ